MEDAVSPPDLEQSGESTQYVKTAWRMLAALASERQHALQHALDSSSATETPGQVRQQQETPCDLTPTLQASTGPEQPPVPQRIRATQCGNTEAAFKEAVRVELQRVKADVSFRHPLQDVVVRLEFMTGAASRVSFKSRQALHHILIPKNLRCQ